MTYEEFKKLGVDGVYRPDLDEWFPVGQEQPEPVNPVTPLTVKPAESTPMTASSIDLPTAEDKAKADKPGSKK